MPLSEHEQRMLKEIESALYADDPKFASSVRKTGSTGPRRPAGLVVVLGIVGLALMVGGLALFLATDVAIFSLGNFPVLSLVGFLVMFAAGVMALRTTPGQASSGSAPTGGLRMPGAGRPQSGSSGGQSYSSRMEDRFRRRFEQEP